ncbi:MAG: HAD family hydrolase [Acidimicrobiia bacterium]|nr:HAD family hydrolase [Acidimicrobiia bacterium]
MVSDPTHTLSPCPVWLCTAQAIVFDKDGTITDLDARWAPFFRSAFWTVVDGDPALFARFEAALGIAGDRLVPIGPAAISTPNQILLLAHRVLEKEGWSVDRRNDAMARGMAAAQLGSLVAVGDVAGAMERLARNGLQLAIATSDGRDNATAEIAELGIEQFISAMACGDDDVVKPDPEVLLRLAQVLGVAVERMVYVGDSDQDRRTAIAAGIPFIEVRVADFEGLGCEVWVRSVAEIADAVELG